MGTNSGWAVGWADLEALAGAALKPDDFGPGIHWRFLDLLVDTQAIGSDPLVSCKVSPTGIESFSTHLGPVRPSRK